MNWPRGLSFPARIRGNHNCCRSGDITSVPFSLAFSGSMDIAILRSPSMANRYNLADSVSC
jgi:hypothetical protein